MNARRVVPLFACVIAFAGLACHKKITSSGIVVPVNFDSMLTVNAGGTVRFISAGAYFKVTFDPLLACNGQTGDLIGTPTHAAVCKVPLGSEGVYEYIIAPSTPLGTHVARAYIKVDHCPGCDYKTVSVLKPLPPPGPPPPPSRADNPPTVFIACDGNAAKADPVKASAGQIVLWSQKGSDKIKWTATLRDDICEGGKKNFGTKDDTPQSCVIKNDAPAGDHPYQVTLSEGCTNPGSATLTVVSQNK